MAKKKKKNELLFFGMILVSQKPIPFTIWLKSGAFLFSNLLSTEAQVSMEVC